MARASILRRLAAVLVPLALVAGAFVAAPAYASAPAGYRGGDPIATDPNDPGPDTEATIVDLRLTSGLYGGFDTAVATNPQTPYPTSISGSQSSHTTAQIVLDAPGASGELLTLCIDIKTDTTIGVHYELGDWTAANVPNLAYVQWILDNYPMTSGSTAEYVRAVQGAVWYFSDGFVVNRFYPTERNAVRTIVQAAQAALAGGTPPAPPLPTLTITPPTATAPAATVTGPYTVATSNLTTQATISIPAGTSVYRNQDRSGPVSNGDAIANGDQLWVEFAAGTTDPGFVLAGAGSVPAGNVYLYDGNNPPRTSAQKLVLAAEAVVPVRAALDITPQATGALQVSVQISGTAAGAQGEIEVAVACPSWTGTRPAYRIAGAPAGPAVVVATFDGLPVGEQCTVSPVEDGGNAYAQVDSFDITQPPVIASGSAVTAAVSASYSVPPPATGALQVDVQIGGAAAGAQGDIDLVVTCESGSGVLVRNIPVAAGITGTTTVATITGLPVATTCDITQPVDGRNAAASLTSTTAPIDDIVITAGTVTATVANVYAVPVPPTGTLNVDLTVAGAAAGSQSEIAVTVACVLDGATRTIPLTAPAGATGTTRLASVTDVEADSVCTLTQTASGANARAILSSSSTTPPSVTVNAASPVLLTITNTYAAPAPTPTPTPTPTSTSGALPTTGVDTTGAAGAGLIGILALLIGASVVTLDILRRRAKKS